MNNIKLKEFLNRVGRYENIRVFAGCITIFNGRKADVSEKEWNIKFNPYKDCEVVRFSVSENVAMVMI